MFLQPRTCAFQEQIGTGSGHRKQHPALERLRQLPGRFQALLRAVHEQKYEQTDGQREQKVHAARRQAREKRKPEQADHYRDDAHVETDQREHPEEARTRRRCFDRDGNFVLESGAGRGQYPHQVGFAFYPRIRNAQIRAAQVFHRNTVIGRKRPERIVYLDLRDVHRVGPVVHQAHDDGAGLQDHSLKCQTFDRREVLAPDRLCRAPPNDDDEECAEQQERHEREQQATRHVVGAPSARKRPIHPSSANSL